VDFLGNISLRLVGLIVTVATLAAAYFFIVRPVTDTTKHAFDSVSPLIQQGERQAAEAQAEARRAARRSDNPLVDRRLVLLQRCVQRAGQNVNRLERCTHRYAPGFSP
jgi:hypothetical protein